MCCFFSGEIKFVDLAIKAPVSTYFKTITNCLRIGVTEINLQKSQIELVQFGCLRITITENRAKLWSVTLTGADSMTNELKDELLYSSALEYKNLPSKKSQSSYIDFFIQSIAPIIYKDKNGNYKQPHRKTVINNLNNILYREPRKPSGCNNTYTSDDISNLETIWISMGYPCGKRMVGMIPDWIDFYNFSMESKSQLLKISAATIDRYLSDFKEKYRRQNNCSTVPAKGHIKKKIALRDTGVRVEKVGHIETDTVVHCGDYIWGTFGNTSTTTDLFSGWTEARMTFGKNAELVVKTLEEMELALPIQMTNLYFDNGIEYINHHLINTFADRADKPIVVARGRAGRSNDQCHVEQKNNVFVRNLIGYSRIESQEIIDAVNDLYKNEWSLLFNYFYTQQKLIEKDRIGAKYRKKYDKAKTPYQRLIDSKQLTPEQELKLKEIKSKLNPVKLTEIVQQKKAKIETLIQKQYSYKKAS